MSAAQSGFHPLPYQQSSGHGAQRNGPPPPKKQRGNPPVITRYAPPPGYAGPAQPGVPHFQQGMQQSPPPPAHQPTWQQPAYPYGYAQSAYPGHVAHAYSTTQAYQPSPYGTYPMQQYPGQQYSPPQYAAPAPAGYPGYNPQAQDYPSSQPGMLAQTPGPYSAPPYPMPPPQNLPHKPRRLHSAPVPSGFPGGDGLVDGNGDPLPPSLEPPDYEIEAEYFGSECYYLYHPDEVPTALSLGDIEWRPPLPNKRALPATFREFELEAIAPRKPHPIGEESVSDYFVSSRRDEALLSVRQLDYWKEVKDDLIFKEFPLVCRTIIPLSEMLEIYRDRPDSSWTKPIWVPTPTPTPEPQSVPPSPISEPSESVMDLDVKPAHEASASYMNGYHADEQADMLGNLEAAISRNGFVNRGRQSRSHSRAHSRSHSRASSVASNASQKITRPKPLLPVRDQAQEDVLTALGVTGSPKVVYQTPGPALGAPPVKREDSSSRHRRQNSFADCTSGDAFQHPSQLQSGYPFQAPPPPPPPPPPPIEIGNEPRRPTSFGTPHSGRRDRQQPRNNSNTVSRPTSSHSQHTAAGSDFGSSDHDATPRPKLSRTDSRKRPRDESDDSPPGDRRRQDDDSTPRQKRRLHQEHFVDDAYRRRW